MPPFKVAYELQIFLGVGHTKVKHVEMESILAKIISDSNKQTRSVKHEAHTL